MKALKSTLVLSVVIGVFISLCVRVSADNGPKPTLDIYVENLEGTDYYLDLLGREDENPYFDIGEGNDNYNHMHEEPIYKYKEDGWMAIHIRNWLLFGNLVGEVFDRDDRGEAVIMKHHFSYVAVPKRFKIIIQRPDGSLQISEVIDNKYFNTAVQYDMKNNRVISIRDDSIILEAPRVDLIKNNGITSYFVRLIVTMVLELVIALCFRYRSFNNIKVILIANFLTQTFLTLGMRRFYPFALNLLGSYSYIVSLVLGELFVFCLEFWVYRIFLEGTGKRGVLLYTLVANTASLLVGAIL